MVVVLDQERPVTLGLAQRQGDLLDDVTRFCDGAVAERSVYAMLHRERDRLFPDEMFADLFSERGRRSVPPSVLATVMVLQRLDGLSDREAVERYAFDARWRYAAGVGGYETGCWGCFAHTVLVDMRARLAGSAEPRRIFEVVLEAAAEAGLVGAKRVLDSTPLYDAVATMDTITLIRSAMRSLLRVASDELEAELRSVLASGDDYATTAKPQIAWDDADARTELIDSRAKDGFACLVLLDGRALSVEVGEAAELLATVLGQDLEESEGGTFRIAQRVAKDRVISTVDPEARHGHKSSARGFDGYKGHAAIDPDSEIITDTVVSAGNVGDASVAAELIDDLIDTDTADTADTADTDIADTDIADTDIADTDTADIAEETADDDAAAEDHADIDIAEETAGDDGVAPTLSQRRHRGGGGGTRSRRSKGATQAARARRAAARRAGRQARLARRRARLERRPAKPTADAPGRPTVYGDAAYGAGEFLDLLARHNIESRCKTQPAVAPGGLFAKDRFAIDLDHSTVTCPAEVTVKIRRGSDGDGTAYFADACTGCALRPECTNAKGGRTIRVGRYEQRLADARAQQQDTEWAEDYRATRPKVERKLAHLMRRRHGGRRARVRGKRKVDADFNLLAAAQNLARLAVVGLHSTTTGWAATAT